MGSLGVLTHLSKGAVVTTAEIGAVTYILLFSRARLALERVCLQGGIFYFDLVYRVGYRRYRSPSRRYDSDVGWTEK